MDLNEVQLVGFALSAGLYLLLTALLLTRWRGRSKSPVIALATLVTMMWAGLLAAMSAGLVDWRTSVVAAEVLRSAVWAFVLVLILRSLTISSEINIASFRNGLILLPVIVIGSTVAAFLVSFDLVDSIQAVACITFNVASIVLCEQLFRQSYSEEGSSLRYFCLAIAGMMFFDVLYYGQAIIEGTFESNVAASRGYVSALFWVPLAYSIRRRLNLEMDSLILRQFVFYSFSLLAVGCMLLVLYGGNLYIDRHDGAWTDIFRIVSIVGVLVLVSTLLVSPSIRGKTRVFFTKSLLQYKYDYRHEWLRFIATLSQSGPDVAESAVRAVAQIVNSPSGIVWIQRQLGDDFIPIGTWNCDVPINVSISKDSGLVSFLRDTEWVIDFEEMAKRPGIYDPRCKDGLPGEAENWWLIVPMLLGDRLSGFLALERSRDVHSLNFEDHDLLKTAGRHIATHIEQAETDRQLAEASQFGAYNKLTAFLMHDLNNLLAQQSLVVENAERFRHNPDFIDDAIETISHSVIRMRHLMDQLSSVSKPVSNKPVSLTSIIDRALERTVSRTPVPQLTESDQEVQILADSERLSMVIQHLLRNAQEATQPEGEVTVAVHRAGQFVEVAIVDTGIGMTQEFIRDRLFRPFDSTKGSQGMGIGAYQAKEYVRSLGGEFAVFSSPGSGTTVLLRLPIVK